MVGYLIIAVHFTGEKRCCIFCFQREQEEAGQAQTLSKRKLRLSMQPTIAELKEVMYLFISRTCWPHS